MPKLSTPAAADPGLCRDARLSRWPPSTTSRADEGMWTFDNFPAAAVKQKYGADITPAWLDRVRTATIRLSNCTASFVSPEGLILTNHHCSAACLAQLSKEGQDRERDGFTAGTREQEVKCPTQYADVLMEMENVTAKVNAATAGKDHKAANDARKKVLTQLETACEKAAGTEGPAPLRVGDAVPGRPVFPLPLQALQRRAHRVRARIRRRRIRWRPGQLPVPALVPGHVGAARLRERQAGRDAELPQVQLERSAGEGAGVRHRSSRLH